MWADNETSEDLLGFKVHADLIIDVIKDETILPVTVGVFGDWGSGKSSILQIVNSELSGNDKDELKDGTLVLYFNGWVFEGYDDAKAALLESIVKQFSEHKKLGNKIKDEAKSLLQSVDWMRALSFGFKKIVLPTAAAYATGGLSLIPFLSQEISDFDISDLEKLGEGDSKKLLEGIIKKKKEDHKVEKVREFRKNFESLINKSEIKRLVVIIDDLDRCTPERIIENLEAIKLFLNVERTAFVIGADPRIVRHAIEFRYKTQGKADEDSNNRIVDDYLEKLIQIPYNLPRLSDSEVETYISLLICKRELKAEVCKKVFDSFQQFRMKNRYSVFGLAAIKDILTPDEQQLLSKSLISIPALVPIITQTLDGNPRRVKRFLNTLVLRQRLAAVAKVADFNDAILAKLMVLEYSELQLFKQVFDWQVSQKGIPAQMKQLEEIIKSKQATQELKAEIENTEGLKNWGKDRVVDWLRVEPSLGEIDLSDYFWLSRDRIASTIPGTSLIPPIIKSIYQQLNQESLTETLTRKIIKEKVSVLSDFERAIFLDFCTQMVLKNPKKTRGYSIFHSLLDEKVIGADSNYIKALNGVNLKDIPISVGQALKRYVTIDPIKEFVDSKIKDSNTPLGKAFNS